MPVTVLDVGQGDAVLIQTPSGVNVLVDGGPSGGVLARALAQADWVAAINPQVALISVGAGNPDGDPSPNVLQRLAGRTVPLTDEHGNLTLLTDGQQVWVESER